MRLSLLAALLLLLAIAGESIRAAANPLTFNVTRVGHTSTYRASSPGETFTGSLKSVVERATRSLHGDGGGRVFFAAGRFDLGSASFEIADVTGIVFAGRGIDVTIIRNWTGAAADTEVFDMSRSDRITVSGMTISAGGPRRSTSDAIDFDGGDDSVVRRVKIIAARGRGIVFDGKDAPSATGGTADRNLVRDCVITGVRGDGIQLLASNNNRVENCRIFAVGGSGINVNKASSSADQRNKSSNRNRIIGNTISNAGAHGIRIHSGNRNLISRNRVLNSSDDGPGRDGINLSSSNSVVCNDNIVRFNTATDNQSPKTQRYGLNIASPECHRTVVRDNNFAGNLVGAIRDLGSNTTVRARAAESSAWAGGRPSLPSREAPRRSWRPTATM
ncbi:MAG: hypothetical protein GEU28_07610 [Dehalococcoidia bacterium]|nr:hypothetical protein [Dehalococcoidia bacterium]